MSEKNTTRKDEKRYEDPCEEIGTPERIPLNPQMTEEKRMHMPAMRFYCMILGFCVGMIVFSALRIALHLTISVHWTFLAEVLCAALGWALSRYMLEPRMYISYEEATAEQKLNERNRLKEARDKEEAEMKRLLGDKYLSKLKEMEEREPEDATASGVDRAVYEDD